MDDPGRLRIFIIIALVLAAALFALIETAYASVSRIKLKVASERGDRRASRALYILDHFGKAISTLLICTNIVHILTSVLVTILVTRIWGIVYVSIGTLATTITVFFIGDFLPKSIAKKRPLSVCLATSGLLWLLMHVFAPASAALTALGDFVAAHTKGDAKASVTEDELYDIIEDMAQEGSIDETREDLISSVLEFDDVTVDSIITPRIDVVGIDIGAEAEDNFGLIKTQSHSRLPVYEGSIDHIIGMLQLRKYMKSYLQTKEYPDIRELMDEVYYAPAGTNIDELLKTMSARKLNMSVVLDSYGGTLGIVTVEDILEEIVGEIWDEDDEISEPLREIADDSFVAEGEETVGDLMDAAGLEDEILPGDEERFTNLLVSDWVYEHFPEVPQEGDSFTYGRARVTVSKMDRNRIMFVWLKVLPEEKGEE